MDPLARARPIDDEIAELEALFAADSRPKRAPWRRVLLAFVLFMLVGNAGIAVAAQVARHRTTMTPLHLDGVGNGWVVEDGRLWRGAAPKNPSGYESLAAAGVTTIVDLRGERDLDIPHERIADLGMDRVAIPIRDGQTPSAAQVQRFLDVLADDPEGLVFVHCGAGVGRTGSMLGAYRALTGDSSGFALLADTLAAGPPSVEQLSFVFKSSGDGLHDNGVVVTGVSRLLDAPRRIWHNLT